MMKRAIAFVLAALPSLVPAPSYAANAADTVALPEQDWSFSGPLGRYDNDALRRGLRVYIDGCWDCHSLRHVAFRNLAALGVGFGAEDIKALAAGFDVQDGPNEDGEMFVRPGRPADRFPSPYANKQEARQMNDGMFPPDLSLITKARKGGPDYLYAMLIGYEEPTGNQMPIPGMHYNPYVPGRYTGMKAPLIDDLVEYDDGTEATVDQMSRDVTEFLAWAADPHMEARKKLGLRVVIFLALLTIMFIALKRETWAHLHERRMSARESGGPAE